MFDFEKQKKKIEEGLLTRSQIQGILDQASFLNLDSNQINFLQTEIYKLPDKIYLIDDLGNVEMKIKKINLGNEIDKPPKMIFGWLGHESESMRLAISEFLGKPKNELPELEWDFNAFNSQKNYYSIADSYLKIIRYFAISNTQILSKVVFHNFSRCSVYCTNNEISHAEIFDNKISIVHNILDKKKFFCFRCDTLFQVPFITHTVKKACPCCGKAIQNSFDYFEFYFEKDHISKISI
jgi:hypothetical protein